MQIVQSKDYKIQEQIYINEINQKLSVMRKSQFRTTNFSLIEYFADNNYKPLIQETLITKLLFDYKKNPKKYVLSNERSSFKSEKNFKSSIMLSISRNKAFIKGPGNGELSLNLEKTLQYLRTMYRQYTNNSTNIHTPYKIFHQKNKPSRNNNVQSPGKSIKKEKEKENNSFDIVNMEIEEQKEKPKNKNKNSEKHLNNNSFNIYCDKSQDESGKIKKENSGSKSPISITNSPSHSISKINDLKKENKKDFPDIFQQILYSDDFIESLKTDKIANVQVNFNNYLLDVKEKKMNDKIEKELEKINNALKTIYDNKKSYDSHYIEIKNWQNELLTVYKIMVNQLKTLKIEINIKSYSYEVYVQLKDIIFKYEIYYNNIVETIKQQLEEIKEIVKELKDKRKFIQNCLYNVHKTIGFCDFNFSRLTRSIEQVLKINNVSLNNSSDFEFYDDEDVKDVIRRLKEEKKEIIDEINGIDKYIGNISIY